MIGPLVEFDEATAFERWALDALVPLPAARPHPAFKDIENNAVRVMAPTATVRAYVGGLKAVQVDLRPLAFGIAWKVLGLRRDRDRAPSKDEFDAKPVSSTAKLCVGPFEVADDRTMRVLDGLVVRPSRRV